MPGDPSTVLCQVVGCKNSKVSRGKQGTAKARLSNSALSNHLFIHHSKEYEEFVGRKDAIVAEKRKAEQESNEESETENVPLFNLRTSGQRQAFLQQTNISTWVGSGPKVKQSTSTTYGVHDPRAKDRHRGVLMMVVLDLQPWSIVNNAGFLQYSYALDPHFKLPSDTFYRRLLDKAYDKSVEKVEDKIRKDNYT